jgi:Type III secretion protein (HpaP)
MSDKDVKRPQRIWSAEELGGKPQLPAKPTRTPTQSGERFSRLLLPSKPMENNGEVALRPGAPTLHTGLAKRSMALARKSDHDGESADACLPAQTESGAAAVLSQHQTVVQALPTAWSQAEAVHQAWCDSVQSAPTLEQMLAQRWPQEVADAAAMLCQRAGDQFTGWRVAIPIDPDALAETELWLEASPQRLLLRFRTLSAWSVRLISLHTERLLALLKQRIGSSRDIDVEIT